MKRVFMMLAVVAAVAAVTGCCGSHRQCCTKLIGGSCVNAPENCGGCGAGCGAGCGCNTMGGYGAYGGPSQGYGGHGGGFGGGGRHGDPGFTPGPSGGAIAYPYYTTHGPRDFLAASPRSLGP